MSTALSEHVVCRVKLVGSTCLAKQRRVIKSVNSDGTFGPSSFEGIEGQIDCVALVDATIEDAERIMSRGPLPTNIGRGLWALGGTSVTISEDGTNYILTWLRGDVMHDQSSLPLDIRLVPKLAMAILMQFRSVPNVTNGET
jgi:hypothetical protein